MSTSGSASIPRSFVDGSSNTIMFATRYAFNKVKADMPDCSSWYAPPFENAGAFFGQDLATREASSVGVLGITFQVAPEPGKVYCALSAIPHSLSKEELHVCLGDASVRGISPLIATFLWMRYLQPNDGYIVYHDYQE